MTGFVTSHLSRLLTTVLTFAAALVFCATAAAQTGDLREEVDSPGLLIEAAAGWDGTVDQARPIPVSFLIRNDSEQIVEGWITLTDPLNGYEVTLEEVVVAPTTTRRVTSIRDLSDWFECFAAFTDGERVLWRRELPLMSGNGFISGVNFALFVNDGGRRLVLPGESSRSGGTLNSQLVVAGERGWPVRCLTVEPWQMPNHPGPLLAAQAMIFPEGADAEDLNQVQWRAVAEWMCQGGVVFVHDQSLEFVERLRESSPLGMDEPVASGEFRVRRAGLGAVYEYSRPLLSSGDNECRQLIEETIANFSPHHVTSLLDSGSLYYPRGGRADMNSMLFVAFFGVYTLLSGVVALCLFRLSQRRIAIYTGVVVIGASVLSGLLGGYLRLSRGDLNWMTVTEAGAGGAVQVGRIQVQSAGGRNRHVAVRGPQADLQFIGRDRPYYAWNSQPAEVPPFTWQPNLAADAEDTYQVNVPITPWGRRRLHATTFARDLPPLEFELEFEPRVAGSPDQPPETPTALSGLLTLKVMNRWPVEITDCRVVVGLTHVSTDATDFQQWDPYGRLVQPTTQVAAVDGLIDVYFIHSLPNLAAGGTCEQTVDADFQAMPNNWDLNVQLRNGSLTLPRIPRLGAGSAWFVGRVEESPIMSIDESRSDFVPHEELHLIVQQIAPEQMPESVPLMEGGADGE